MTRWFPPVAAVLVLVGVAPAQDASALAGKRVVFLGDSITQAGGYVGFADHYLGKPYPTQDFDLLGLGLASETLSGLSEAGHAGGKFPRPCLFERLGRVLAKAKPDVVFACYGMNDGIYQPLDKDRFAAFQKGVTKLIEQCEAAGVKQIYLITPPIYDYTPKAGEVDYDAVLTEYAKWERALKVPGVVVIDLHTVMRKARAARTAPLWRGRSRAASPCSAARPRPGPITTRCSSPPGSRTATAAARAGRRSCRAARSGRRCPSAARRPTA